MSIFRVSQTRTRSAGFTLTELVAVVACLVILAAIFIPYLRHVRERNNRTRCAENLRQIQMGLTKYGEDNGKDFPRVRVRPDKPDGYVAFTGGGKADPFAERSAVQPNDVTASLWLLVRQDYVDPQAFICPSTDDVAGPEDKSLGNFPSSNALSYSYATPFSSLSDYRLNSDRLRAEFVVLADRNPGAGAATKGASSTIEALQANSHNHAGAGQNVLYGAGNVEFHTTPYCGFGQDNIYTALAITPIPSGEKPPPDATGVVRPDVGPAWYADSYLVPTAQE